LWPDGFGFGGAGCAGDRDADQCRAGQPVDPAPDRRDRALWCDPVGPVFGAIPAGPIGAGCQSMSAFAALMAHQHETEALAQIAGRLSWDQETVMPRGAARQRGEEMAAIESVLHSRRTDPRIGEWLAAIDPGALDDVG